MKLSLPIKFIVLIVLSVLSLTAAAASFDKPYFQGYLQDNYNGIIYDGFLYEIINGQIIVVDLSNGQPQPILNAPFSQVFPEIPANAELFAIQLGRMFFTDHETGAREKTYIYEIENIVEFTFLREATFGDGNGRIIGKYLAYTSSSCHLGGCLEDLYILDISDIENPQSVASDSGHGGAPFHSILQSQNYDYISLDGLRIRAKNDSTDNFIHFPDGFVWLMSHNNIGYATINGTEGIYDFSTPASPSLLPHLNSTIPLWESDWRVRRQISNSYFVYTKGNEIQVHSFPDFNASNAVSLPSGNVLAIHLLNNRLYVISGAGFYVYQLTGQANITLQDFYSHAFFGDSIEQVGTLLVMRSEYDGLQFFDTITQSFITDYVSFNSSYPNDIILEGNFAYLSKDSSLLVMDMANPSNPIISDAIKGRGDWMVKQNDFIYMMDLAAGRIRILNVFDPDNIVASPPYSEVIRGVLALYDHYLLVLSWEKQLHIFDISDPTTLVPVATLQFSDSATLDQLGLAISNGFAYASYGDAGILQIDLSDPTDPQLVGALPVTAFSDEVLSYGNYLINSSKEIVEIIDNSNPNSPTVVDQIEFGSDIFFVDIDNDQLFVTTYREMHVFDLTTPASPQKRFTYPVADAFNPQFSNGFIPVGIYGLASNGMDTYISPDSAAVSIYRDPTFCEQTSTTHLAATVQQPFGAATNALFLPTIKTPAVANGGGTFDEPVGAYQFDFGGFHGSCFGAACPTAGVAGVEGTAVSFDGSNDMISLGAPKPIQTIQGEITIAAWIKPDAVDGLRNIVARGYSLEPAGEVFLRINNGSYEIGSWDGTTTSSSSYAIPAGDVGSWVHLAGVYDGAAWKLYRNGVLVNSSSSATGAQCFAAGWAIGARATGTERFFDGVIDNVAIYDVALDEAAIQGLAE